MVTDRNQRMPLKATYRLQLGPTFTFEHAGAVVPYLAQLGVSHVYLSPIWQAFPGSTHGYDVIDHARINTELGGMAGFYTFAAIAHEHRLGIILDLVPNHVGIKGATHPWWRDVLRYGPQSPYAGYFDIDWIGQPQMPSGVLSCPVLGQPFGLALEAGEFRVAMLEDELVIRYHDATFPVAPASYASVFGLPTAEERELASDAALEECMNLLDAMKSAAPAEAEVERRRFSEILAREPALRAWCERRAEAFNGTVGDAHSFDRLEELMRLQPYRLVYWRVSAEETNYRRFFDINELAAIRVEDEAVFEATHRLVRELVHAGLVDGLRIDHVDGLYDPERYLRRLNDYLADGAPPDAVVPFIWVEKILADGETLPAWPVAGTTGYDFAALAGRLQIDSAGEQPMTAIYDEFAGQHVDYGDVAFAARRRVAERSFAGEVNVLALQLYRLAQGHRQYRDNTLRSLREAIAALLSCFPVYRVYLQDGEPRPGDRSIVEGAAEEARKRDPNVTVEALDFLVDVILLEDDSLSDEERMRWVHFRRRFQQVSSPVMAKGVEDTTFFRHHRLLALNEVGSHPDHFGISPAEAHSRLHESASRPHAMLATTTHDTKRSEDARARLAVLSEMPRAWRREVRAWARMNARSKRMASGFLVPGRSAEYAVYQALVASWDGPPDTAYRRRIEEHVVKSAREAKLQTSWATVNEGYESALVAFVRAILDRRRSMRFIERISAFVQLLEPARAANSLGLVALKSLAPGVPDFYQGAELPLFTLTDPDNRQPVDFARRIELIERPPLYAPVPIRPESKFWLTTQMLRLRGAFPELLSHATYTPVEAEGPEERRIFAFQRTLGRESILLALLRTAAPLLNGSGCVRAEPLQGTTVELPGSAVWRRWLPATNERCLLRGKVTATELFDGFPVSILVREPDDH